MRKVFFTMFISIISCILLIGCTNNSEVSDQTKEEESGETSTPTNEGNQVVTGELVYKESPFLADKGLAPVEERLPHEPKLTNENPDDWYVSGKLEIGEYGGKLRMISPDVNFNPDLFIMLNEALLNTPGILGEEVTGNVVKDYEVSADQTEFTFYMREGLKWSDGVPVTTEDVLFAYEDVMLNEELTPVFPTLFRTGGKPDGEPMVLEVIDDYTFKIKFAEPYGGILMKLSISGWVGYTDILKPKHYLSQYHTKYTPLEDLEDDIEAAGYEEGAWTNLFHEKDILNWENTNTNAVGFPSLQPWVMTESTKEFVAFERNPYYFKIDAAGNQLPYIDEVQSSLVQDKQMETLKMISGEVDAANGILMSMPLYKENEKNGNYTTGLYDMHVTPVNVALNLTHEDPVWRVLVRDVRFREALNMAIDREEIIDSIYFGHAELPTMVPSEYDPERAKEILDEIGLDERDGDGYRLGPDGETFVIPFEVAPQDADMMPVSELIVDFWNAIGIKTTTKEISTELMGTRQPANELKASIIWVHTPLWYYGDMGTASWAPLWELWRNTNGEEGEEPPEEVKQFYELMRKTATELPDDAKAAFDESMQLMYDNIFYMNLVDNAKNPYIWNSDIGNVPVGGYAITNSFSAEQVFYRQAN